MTRKPTPIRPERGCLQPPAGPEPRGRARTACGLVPSEALDALLERGLKAIVALSGARGGAIRLAPPDGGGGTLRLACAVGLPPEILARENLVDDDCGMCGAALRTDDVQVHDAHLTCARRMGVFASGLDTGPMLAVPLHCRGSAIGVYSLY